MGSMTCMNEACRATTSSELKKGWSLKSSGFAKLCYKCGSAYENSLFCETFHQEESGWRDCRVCGKMVHCGCIASKHLYEYMEFGGVICINCTHRLEINSVPPTQIPADIPNGKFIAKSSIRDGQPVVIENRINDEKFVTDRLLQLTRAIGVNHVPSSAQKIKREEFVPKTAESTKHVQNLSLMHCSSSPAFVKAENTKTKQGVKDMYETLAKPSLNFSFTTPLGGSSSELLPISGGTIEGNEQSKSSFQQGQKSRNIALKPPKTSSDSNKGALSQMRIPRPPAEGRGRSQLLPRYWPRITDQELQLLSGELKAAIVPLFEKILSASDAGRIGRLVLPKACAEAYFPTINQSEGIPIRIQDIKGKEWTFQFRFWPNNNSRMYVLEGVTPCIQNMQLQAGDTVIFSRRDPGGQLVIGCRKATNNVDAQDAQAQVSLNSDSPGESQFSGVAADTPQLSNGGRVHDDSQQQQHMTTAEKKKARNIKNKRLHMNNDDASELRVTWDEAQELFRPAPSSEPTIFMVDDHEFEEFEEPPVFGKRTMFLTRPSGEQEQLAQCDICSKWRRIPVKALLPATWTCSSNVWDPNRCSCAAPEDLNPNGLDYFPVNKDFKKQKIGESKGSKEGGEPSGLDALANAAVLGDNINIGAVAEVVEFSGGATTRHPRHRPGCSCIVCIQPPSGKGKHEPTCKCNVCLTVRRRFKTLMIRKKKRQLEREAELAQDKVLPKLEKEDDVAGLALLNMNSAEIENVDGDGRLDLNSDPSHREDEILAEAGVSLATLMNTVAVEENENGVSVEVEENGIGESGEVEEEKEKDKAEE